jgi:hypothetical protein
MAWKDNTIMFWEEGTEWRKITDHNRSPLTESYERIENRQRMVDGTLRRYTVAKKRSWTCSWNSLPSTNSKVTGITTADGGWAGESIEAFHEATDGAFRMEIRRGDGTTTMATVMITDFNKTIVKRGIVDLWDLDVTIEEV